MADNHLHIIQSVSVRWFNACAFYGVTLSNALKNSGHDITVSAPVASPAYENATDLDLTMLDLPPIGNNNPVKYLRSLKACRSYAQNHSIDLVNTINGSDHSFWSVALAGTGIPLVRTFCNRIMKTVNPGKRFLMRHTNGAIVSCIPLKERCAELYRIDSTQIPVINGGIDTDYFCPGCCGNGMRTSLGIPEDALVFGIIGRFSPVKGHQYFFEAASILHQSYPDAYFLVSGVPAQLSRDTMERMISEAGIADRTIVLGRSDDVRELIATCNIGVVASLDSEVICRIAMEYMAMGLPVIAADTNVLPEVVIHDKTGIVVPAGDSDALLNAMDTLVSNKDYRTRLGRQARETAIRNFSLESFAEKTFEQYHRFINAR